MGSYYGEIDTRRKAPPRPGCDDVYVRAQQVGHSTDQSTGYSRSMSACLLASSIVS